MARHGVALLVVGPVAGGPFLNKKGLDPTSERGLDDFVEIRLAQILSDLTLKSLKRPC